MLLPDLVERNAWSYLKEFTDARIAIGRSGVSIPTREVLRFQLAHAQARDAVLQPLDTKRLYDDLEVMEQRIVVVKSKVTNRTEYLRRPDLGRQLSASGAERLAALAASQAAEPDIALVFSEGLSSIAIQNNLVPFLKVFRENAMEGVRYSPLVHVEQGRVAAGDAVAAILGAKVVVMLIGERPGLTSPDSMGIYMTYDARPGTTDERRNCISNIRPAGQSYAQAAETLHYLLRESLRRGISGVDLKDDQVAVE